MDPRSPLDFPSDSPPHSPERYDYVSPNDVPALLDQHIAKGEVIQKIWRGQMGPRVAAEVKEADDQKLANGDDKGSAKKKHIEINNLSNNEGIEETSEAHKKQGSKISWNWPVLQEHQILTAAGILGALGFIILAFFCKEVKKIKK